MEKEILTVARYIDFLNTGLKKFAARIIGEISQVTHANSGHVYFTLKDKDGSSVMRCAIWNSNYKMCGVELEEGLEIVANGCPNIYAPRGELTFVAQTVELFGEGELKKAYDRLKKKLTVEGLFKEERKRSIPRFPEVIGVITSREGAVIHDFLSNIGKHGFIIQLVHSGVEGQEAILPLLEAMRVVKKQNVDVLVIMRGGGSLESLQAFNNEALVREIVSFPAPVIAGIGHHRDVPLATLAADVTVSTPTAAAHLLNERWNEQRIVLERIERNIVDNFTMEIREWRSQFEEIVYSIPRQFESLLESVWQNIKLTEKTIALNDPRRQFRLGFSIARQNGKVVRSVGDVVPGAMIDTEVTDGMIISEVKDKK